MRTKGLVYKTVTTFTVIIAVSFIIIAMILSLWFDNYYLNQRKSRIATQSDLLKGIALSSLDEDISISNVQQLLVFVGNYLNADIALVDSGGIVYAVSDNKNQELPGMSILGKDLEELRNGRSVERKNTYEQIFKEPVYMYAQPVIGENSMFRGGVVIYTPTRLIKEPLERVYAIIWICSALAVICSSFIIYFFSKKLIIQPLAEINSAAKKIAKGEVERRVEINTNDEISELAESFNFMADSIEKVEKIRREFISNVSHELRSPITSIKGFIGGILDGVIPKDKENYYLSVAYEEIQRLTRLINDLLDLSTMEAGKFSLRVGELDINEIIRICVINFETKINQKKLKVDVLLQDEHLYVIADRDRLIQIVTNLLDNAVKYVSDEGYIKITTRTKGEKVLVSVFNNGPCIAHEDIKHIWDRFYKSDKSRTSKVSTGLGLPIVRNILTQLGEDIWVENKEKEGVTFIFTLKKV